MGWQDDTILSAATSAPDAVPALPSQKGNLWDNDPILATADQLSEVGPKAASGLIESTQSGWQQSNIGMGWRGKLPDIFADPKSQSFWEGLSTAAGTLAGDLPSMIIGGVAGAPLGVAAGTAIAAPTGPGAALGALAGGTVGSWVGMGMLPEIIRAAQMHAYRTGEIQTKEEFWQEIRDAAQRVVTAGAISGATGGAAGIANRLAGRVLAPMVGEVFSVPVQKVGQKAIESGGFAATAKAVEIASIVLALPAIPAAAEGRWPDAREFGHGAIIIGGLSLGHAVVGRVSEGITARRLMNIYEKTGITPAEVVANAKEHPEIAKEMVSDAEDRGASIPEQLTKQEELWSIQARLTEIERKASGTPETTILGTEGKPLTIPAEPGNYLTDAERAERDALRIKVITLKAERAKAEVPRETAPSGFTPEQLTEARDRAAARIAELTTQEGKTPLTDAERVERNGLVNSLNKPEELARRFEITPERRIPTAEERTASAQRVYDDVLRQVQEVDAARSANGLDQLGEEHARAVAALVRARVQARADRLGMLPEDIYNERPLKIRDQSQGGGVPEELIPPEAPRFPSPEVDIFGNKLEPETQHAVAEYPVVKVPVADIKLSTDVPQFKAGGNAKGVVEPLQGEIDLRGVPPVALWERLNGDLELISGRHRLDLWERKGMQMIDAQIFKESEGFDVRQAAMLDAEMNIRDEHGSVSDYANYFKNSGISETYAKSRGLLDRAKGQAGFRIAHDASPDLLAAHRAGLLSDDAALAISQTAPGSERLQVMGIAMVNDGKSILYATNMMRSLDLMASERAAAGQQGDIFGFDDSAMVDAAAMAKKASSAQRHISEQIAAVSGAVKRPELARKMGVNVEDPEGIKKRIAELRQEQYRWDNWPLYPELVARLRGEEGAAAKEPAAANYAVDLGARQDVGGFEPGKVETPTNQFDLFTPTKIPGSPIEGLEKIVVEPAQVGKHAVAFNRIREAGEAASVFQHLNDSPMEKFQVLGLDAKDKPIAYFTLFSGTLSQTSVYPREVWTAIYQTPGIKSVWIAHQHPSGIPEPSAADRMLTGELRKALTPDIGVTLRGHLIVTRKGTIDIGASGDVREVVEVKEGKAKKAIPIMERKIIKSDEERETINSPSQVREFFRKMAPNETGLLVLDTQHGVIGWWPMAEAEMARLRTGDVNTGMGALIRKVGRGNVSAAIAYSPGKATPEFARGVKNIGTALTGADVRVLDAFTVEEGGRLASFAETGKPTTSMSGTFFQTAERPEFDMRAETPAEAIARDAEAAAAAKRKITQEKEGVKGQAQTVDQADMFALQRGLFQGQERNGEHLGSYTVAENLITTFKNANKSTIVHELGHSWLEEMKVDALRPDAPAQIKADWETVRREFAIGESGEIDTASHEQFARTAERYLAEGRAPSVGLRGVFERFKTWMLDIYKNLSGISTEINPEVRDVFDRMLATDQEIADAKELGVPRAYVDLARKTEAEKIIPEARKIEPGFAAEQASMNPFADELPPGPGEAPDNIHVNYKFINSPMDVKLAMQRMAEIDQANIQKQRGGVEGVKSWAAANAEQARYLNDILGGSEDTLRILSPRDPKAPGVDVRLGVMKKLMVGAAKDSARLRDVILEAGHDATVRQQLEYMGSIERARMVQAEFLGERAAFGRGMNALKDVTEGSGEIGRMLDVIGYGERAARELYQAARTPAEEQAYLKAQLDAIMLNYRGKTVLDIAKLHREVGSLRGSYGFTKKVTEATKWEMLVEGWKSFILSGPVTHTTNFFGTEAFHWLQPAVDVLAATIGMARGASPGMGETDRASMSEAIGRMTGMLSGVQDGLKVGMAAMRTGEGTGKTESYRESIPGQLGHVIRTPLRLMGAEDAMVTTMYERGELKTLAIRQAFDENLNPKTQAFAARVEYLVDHPTPEIEARALATSTRMTFNAPFGEKGRALTNFINKWNLQWMIPFTRTPINIAQEMLRLSPFAPILASNPVTRPLVGDWYLDIAKGGAARDRAIAEVVLGTGISALTMAYAFSGSITGAGSPDPGKNRSKEGVWQPYSIFIDGKWYEYSRIQPVGTLMGMAADMANIWDHMTDEEKDKLPKMISTAFANAITNQTFLQGITNFVNAISDPTRFAPRLIEQFAGSMVPNLVAQPAAMMDPNIREINGMFEAIQARIPGYREGLLPSRDWLGEPRASRERVGVIMPIRELKPSEDKVRLEAARLNLSLAAPPKKTHLGKGTGKIGDVPLTPEEQDTFAKVGGEMTHKILTNIVNAPGYDEIPDLVKRKIFSKVVAASHQAAAVAALPMDKRTSYLQSISEKMQAELAPGE